MEKIRKAARGRRSAFSEAFKHKVVLEYHNSRDTLEVVARRHGIGSSTLVFWIKRYEQERLRLLSLEPMGAACQNQQAGNTTGGNESESASETTPQPGELKALQEELRLAKVKLACLETLIDLTERDLGIDIRKKAGTRSSEA